MMEQPDACKAHHHAIPVTGVDDLLVPDRPIWRLRQHPQVLELPFVPGIRRPDRDNAIDLYIAGSAAFAADGAWEGTFTACPPPLTAEMKAEWIAKMEVGTGCT